VALDTEAHLKGFFHKDTVHLCDVAVTFAAIDARLYMRLVAEVSKFLKDVYTNPFNGDFIVIIVSQVRDLRVVYDYSAMAEHTGLDRRNTCDVGVNRAGMAKDTAYLFFGDVDSMTEWYRLLRTDFTWEQPGISNRHKQNQYAGCCRKHNREPVQQMVFFLFRRI
jgi:hypothetical protein